MALRSRFANLVRRKLCGQAEEPKYKIRIAYPRDYDSVSELMARTYLKSEPSIVNLGGATSSPALAHLMADNVREGMTLVAEDRDSHCLVGAAVNVATRRGDEWSERLAERCRGDERARQLVGFFAFCSRQADPWRAYRVDVLFECAHVAVQPEHCGQGLARRLVADSWILARDLAYRLFRIDCSSRYTAKVAESFGWRCIYSMPYRRYLADGDSVFKCVTPPHTEMRIFVDRLDHYASYEPVARRDPRYA